MYRPRLQTAPIRTLLVEVVRTLQDGSSIGVPLAPHGKPVVDMSVVHEQIEQFGPDFITLAGILECVGVPNHDERIACPRQKNVKALRCTHEANIFISVASCKGCNDNVAFLSLIIVYHPITMSAKEYGSGNTHPYRL
jgi:hypothetical protein